MRVTHSPRAVRQVAFCDLLVPTHLRVGKTVLPRDPMRR